MSHMSTPSMVRLTDSGGESEYCCKFIDSNLIAPPKTSLSLVPFVLHDEVIASLVVMVVVVVGEMDQKEKMVERQSRFLMLQS